MTRGSREVIKQLKKSPMTLELDGEWLKIVNECEEVKLGVCRLFFHV